MKKIIISFFIFILLPYNIFAYSKYVIPGGENIGIQINSQGLIVVGFYKINGEYIAKESVKIGDIIIKINNISVNSVNELSNIINKSNIIDGKVNITIKRNNKEINTYLTIIEDNNIYKTGLYIKDSVTGIGTLTYIDPISKIYGALGHEIVLNETNKKVEVRDGNILLSKVNGIDKSRNGHVGSKDATISYNSVIGTITKNTERGIFGIYSASLPKKNTMEVMSFDEISIGNATILTVTKNSVIKEYSIKILDKYYNKKDTQKSFSFEITDEDLISSSGGIVQGMSGSPIIQDGKIVGAVTNVLVDNVTLGYGISIIKMLEEGEK